MVRLLLLFGILIIIIDFSLLSSKVLSTPTTSLTLLSHCLKYLTSAFHHWRSSQTFEDLPDPSVTRYLYKFGVASSRSEVCLDEFVRTSSSEAPKPAHLRSRCVLTLLWIAVEAGLSGYH